MDALKALLAPEAYAQLEQLATLDARYAPSLLLLDLAAGAVALVASTVAQARPLATPEEVPAFSFDVLDLATVEIGAQLRALFGDKDPLGRLFEYAEVHSYRLSADYATRKARIVEAGKYPLLLRISRRLASK